MTDREKLIEILASAEIMCSNSEKAKQGFIHLATTLILSAGFGDVLEIRKVANNLHDDVIERGVKIRQLQDELESSEYAHGVAESHCDKLVDACKEFEHRAEVAELALDLIKPSIGSVVCSRCIADDICSTMEGDCRTTIMRVAREQAEQQLKENNS